jgi:MinD superfamily P-loop ATPase
MSHPAGSADRSRTRGSLPLAGTSSGRQLLTELAVVSGKGGTGKTSITASFAVLAEDAVLADCDVDAADLHLVLAPRILEQREFWSGHEAAIRSEDCDGCGICSELCRFGAIRWDDDAATPSIEAIACEGCGVCAHVCPLAAIDLVPRRCGEWFVSDTRCGPMVHARLGIAAENSGKLVSTVRAAARAVAGEHGRNLIVIDGPPGIGCPVIAAMTGASAVLAVTEPSVSGKHDLDRVLDLAAHFRIPTAVCVNRWDLDPDSADRIERRALERGSVLAGRVRYDRRVTEAQVNGITAVEFGGPAAADIRSVWHVVTGILRSSAPATMVGGE